MACQVIYKGQSFDKAEIERHIDEAIDREGKFIAKNTATPPPLEDTGVTAPAPEPPPITGLRNSIVTKERQHRNLQPFIKEAARHWADNWNEVNRQVREGNLNPRQFIDDAGIEIAKGNKPLFSDYDRAVSLWDKLNTLNDIKSLQDDMEAAKGDQAAQFKIQQALDVKYTHLEQNDFVNKETGREAARSLSAMQMVARLDGQLVSWTREIAQLYGDNPPTQVRDYVQKIENEYKAKAKELADYYESELKKQAEEAFQKVKSENKTAPTKTTTTKKSIKLQGKDLADKIRKLRPGTDAAQANIFGLPIAVYDTALVTIANAVEGGAKLIDAINEAIKDIKFNADKDKYDFIAHLQNIEEPESMQAKRANLIEDIKSISKENDATNLVGDAVKPLRQLMTNYVKDGQTKTLDELVKKIHDDLKDSLPDMDEKDIRDAFSGYGIKPDSEAKVKSDLSKLREQAKQVSEYQEVIQRVPGETPAQEGKRVAKANELYKKVQDYMRQMGIDVPPPPVTEEGRKAVALAAAKKRMNNIIKDLNKQILAGERKQRNNIEPDTELKVLRAERDRLSKQLDEIEKSKLSPEEQIKQAEDAINRQIFNYEKQIKEGVNPLKPKEERPTSMQLEAMRKRKADLKKQVDRMRKEITPDADRQQIALDRYNEELQKRIDNLTQKIANKDFEPTAKKTQDFTKDAKAQAMEAQLAQLEKKFKGSKRLADEYNRKTYAKAFDLATQVKRGFVLSGLTTIGKLGGAVFERVVSTPIEELTGLGLYGGSQIPILGKPLDKVIQAAEREGIPSLQAEVRAFKGMVSEKAWRDFVGNLKNGYGELDLMYGDKGHTAESDVPKEFRDFWHNMAYVLETPGRIHGAIKSIPKRFEFERAYVLRKESARRKGYDVTDPVVEATIGSAAYVDAKRSILMGDNALSSFYQKNVIEAARKSDKPGVKALSLIAQELMPIVKIPTNFALETGRYTIGTAAAIEIGVRAIAHAINGESKWGFSKMSPEHADALLRNLKKGAIGVAFMSLGALYPNLFGASHYYSRGIPQPDDLEQGEVKFLGMTIPSWLAHHPLLEAMKVGATLRSVYNYYREEKDEDQLASGAKALSTAGGGLMEEIPLLGTPSEVVKTIQKPEGKEAEYFWSQQVKGLIDPVVVQELARWTDNENKWYDLIRGKRIQRDPQSFGERIKLGFPGLREQVQEK